jgi:hypothetical protein
MVLGGARDPSILQSLYGVVGKDRIDYPFNLECGTSHEYTSYAEAWIYDSQGIRSNPVEVALTCTT